jgi:predicted nucleic-acid-binding protein
MIGLDTNVLVRYVMQDDVRQSAKATQLIESLSQESKGFVSLVALIESIWVFECCYELKKPQVVMTIEQLLRSRELLIESSESVWKALRVFKSATADFADCMIGVASHQVGCATVMTFDRAASKLNGMTLLE